MELCIVPVVWRDEGDSSIAVVYVDINGVFEVFEVTEQLVGWVPRVRDGTDKQVIISAWRSPESLLFHGNAVKSILERAQGMRKDGIVINRRLLLEAQSEPHKLRDLLDYIRAAAKHGTAVYTNDKRDSVLFNLLSRDLDNGQPHPINLLHHKLKQAPNSLGWHAANRFMNFITTSFTEAGIDYFAEEMLGNRGLQQFLQDVLQDVNAEVYLEPTIYWGWSKGDVDCDFTLYATIFHALSHRSKPWHVATADKIEQVRAALGYIPPIESVNHLSEWLSLVLGERMSRIKSSINIGGPMQHQPVAVNRLVVETLPELLKCDPAYMDGFDFSAKSFIRAGLTHAQLFTKPQFRGMTKADQTYIVEKMYIDLPLYPEDVLDACFKSMDQEGNPFHEDYIHAGRPAMFDGNAVHDEIMKHAKDFISARWMLRNIRHIAKVRNIRGPDGRVVRFHNTDMLVHINQYVLFKNPYTGWKKMCALLKPFIDEQIEKMFNEYRELPSHPVIEDALKSNPQVRLLRNTEDLRIEGVEMKHCVGGYTQTCLKGDTWILHVGGEKHNGATIEVNSFGSDLSGKECFIMQQIRSYDNDSPTEECKSLATTFMESLIVSAAKLKQLDKLAA